MTIDGSGTNVFQQIDGSSRTGIFVVKRNDKQPFLVDVRNVALVDGASTTASAGIQHENGELHVTNVRIENSTTSNSNGGAITSMGKIMLSNVTVTRCYASAAGGAVYLTATADAMIQNSIFDDNKSGVEGAGIATLGRLYLSSSTLRNGTTGTVGGGIYATGNSMVMVVNSTIASNFATVGGGGLYLTGFASITSNTVLISNNSAGNNADGGGIVVANSAQLMDMNSIIQNNDARDGAGIFTAAVNGTQVKLHGTIVRTNSATRNGGGIYASNVGNTLPMMYMTSVSRNSAQQDGGGLHLSGAGAVTNSMVRYLTVDSNTAGRDGGGLHSVRSLSIAHSSIFDNTATRNGGGVYQMNEMLTFMQSTSANNQAATGAGLYISDDNGAMITESIIMNNTALSNGGGVFVASQTIPASHLRIERSTFVANRASQLGGGIFTEYPFDIINATISGNEAQTTTANYSGGGLYVAMNPVKATSSLVNATIVNNLSPGGDGGAGIAVQSAGNGITMQNTMVASNIATRTSVRRNLKLAVSTAVVSLGYNLIGNIGAQQWNSTTGDLVGTDASPINPNIAPIANNGGFAPTHLIQTSSPAVNAGTNASAVMVDQRGYLRVERYDIGAFESRAQPAPQLTAINPDEIFQALNPVSLQFQGQNLINPMIRMEVLNSPGQTIDLTNVTGNSTSVTASIPAGFAATSGTVRITVQTIGGTTWGSFTILPLIAPTIASITPNVTNISVNPMDFSINGKYFFQPSVEVRVLRSNSTPGGILPLNVISASTTQIRSAIPAGYLATLGTLTVTVRTAAGSTSSGIVITELPAPTLLSPTNGTIRFTDENTENVLLRWSSIPEALSYTYQVSTMSSFNVLATTQTVTTNQHLARNLPVNTRCYWRVRANRNTGQSSWSPTWNFAIVTPLTVNISQTADFICDSADVELTANVTGGFAAFLGNADYRYRWFVKRDSDTNFIEAGNANGGKKTFKAPMLDQTVRYRVRVIDASDADTAFAETIVVVRPKPRPVIIGRATACENAEAVYSVQDNLTGQGNTYIWTVSGGQFVGSNSSATVTVLWGAAGNGFLSLTETSGEGCFKVTELPVSVVTPTAYTIQGTAPVCLETQTATFEYTIDELSGATYDWSVDGGTIISEDKNKVSVRWNVNTAEGSVNVNITGNDLQVCPDVAPLPVFIGRVPVLDMRPDKGSVDLGDTISLSIDVTNKRTNDTFTYAWLPAESLDDATSRTPRAFPTDTTTYTVTVTDNRTGCTETETVTINVNTGVSVEEYAAKQGFALLESSPNPFSETTSIRYTLEQAGTVSIIVTDIFGKEVKTIKRGLENAGNHSVPLSAESMAQGTYYVSVSFNDVTLTKTIVVVK
jgi:hypothetical protein